jgi:hypothetical protein
MVELRRQSEIIDAMDGLWNQLLTGAPEAQRMLSFNLYHAALAVAVHGCEEVSGQLADRAATWRAARVQRSTDERQRFRAAHTLQQSNRESVSATTAEKRRNRKPRK